ncbi:MAG TPA: hypothetical protein VN461_11730 [Vicinamibacteria bacterium]|jgi:hypothetical protein|nr:hypothetical protein [Vicinamibacteria bacterium]
MRDTHAVIAAAVVAGAMTLSAVFLLGGQGSADASVLSRGSRGWLAARRYLEERGCRVSLLDHALDEPVVAGVLVLALPWQELGFEDLSGGIGRHLGTGRDIVFAYSADVFDSSASAVADALDLAWDDRRGRPPLNPSRWRQYASEEWSLAPEPLLGDGLRPVRIEAPRRVPRLPTGATVLLRDGRGGPTAFTFPRSRGHVTVLPADAFSNARLGEPGNADLLETLLQRLGDRWVFDEFHHGLRASLGPGETGPQRIFLLYLLQVAFVYVLGVVAVARHFGPVWSEPLVARGSAATFLVALGALHNRLGHQHAAARLLLSRARELDGRLALPDDTRADAGGFLELARCVGEAQSGKGKSA